jgi:hypothetical protein
MAGVDRCEPDEGAYLRRRLDLLAELVDIDDAAGEIDREVAGAKYQPLTLCPFSW